MNAWKLSLLVLQSGFALVVSFAGVMVVNLAATPAIAALLPGSMSPDGIPLTVTAQAVYLPVLFLAGVVGAFLMVFVAPRAPVVHAVVFGVLALAGDIVVVREHAATWQSWFSLLVVTSVPLQVWLGAVLGMRARRRWAPWARIRKRAAVPG